MAENEVTEEEATERSTSVTILVENESPFSSDVLEERSRSPSIPCSGQSSLSNLRTGEKFRTLKRRSSVENFGQFGFLVPALALFPQADGVSFINFNLSLKSLVTSKLPNSKTGDYTDVSVKK